MATSLPKTNQINDAGMAHIVQDLDASGDISVGDDLTVTGDLSVTGSITAAGFKQGYVAVTDAASYTVLAANSGKIHAVPNLTASCTIDLPAAADGLVYEFVYAGVASDAQDWVIDTGSNTNYFIGGVMFADHDSADAEIAPVAGDGNSNSKLTVVTPAVGTTVRAICNGTTWLLSGFVNSASVPTFADQ